MNIVKRFLFGTILLSLSTMFIVSAGAVDEEIKQLNDDLILTKMGEAEKVIGLIPANAHPESFLVNGWYWPFDKQAPKILRLIEVLVQNKQEASCRECLDSINSVFYLQCHKFVNDLSDDKFEAQDKSIGGKDQVLEVLFRTYYCQSTAKSVITYSYEPLPLALIMTKTIINMFFAKMNSSWTYKQKQSLIRQTFFSAKSELWYELNSCSKNLPAWRSVNIEETDLCVSFLHKAFTEEASPYPWGRWIKTGAKYTVVTAIILGATILTGWAVKTGYDKIKTDGRDAVDYGKKAFLDAGEGLAKQLKEVGENFGKNAGQNAGENAGKGMLLALKDLANDPNGKELINKMNEGGVGFVGGLEKLVAKIGPELIKPFVDAMNTLVASGLLKSAPVEKKE